jgi:molybdenum cofactor cytidylyltransferase
MGAEISTHGAIVLAAGASQRLGQPKQLLRLAGVSLVRHAAAAALATSPDETVVVVGAIDLSAALRGLPVRLAHCANWNEGLAASLRTGIAALSERCDAALVILCDQPALTATHLATLVAQWRAHPQHAVCTRYAEVRGVPAVLPRAWFTALKGLHGDHGARELLRDASATVIEIEAEALARDIDSIDDL